MDRRANRSEVANDLSPRVRPVQARAKQTVDLILDNAGVLLDEVGVDAFNTNLLAERAGVAVRSVYRYYPNKLAVIVGLAERQASEWQALLARLALPLSDPNQSACNAWDAVLDAYVSYIEAKQGRSAMHRAMQALPQLSEVNRRDNEVLADTIYRALKTRGLRQPAGRLQSISKVLLDTMDVSVDEALRRRGRVARPLLDELKRMHRSYLEPYLG